MQLTTKWWVLYALFGSETVSQSILFAQQPHSACPEHRSNLEASLGQCKDLQRPAKTTADQCCLTLQLATNYPEISTSTRQNNASSTGSRRPSSLVSREKIPINAVFLKGKGSYEATSNEIYFVPYFPPYYCFFFKVQRAWLPPTCIPIAWGSGTGDQSELSGLDLLWETERTVILRAAFGV